RHACTVEVDGGFLAAEIAAMDFAETVQALARVFLQMHPRDTDLRGAGAPARVFLSTPTADFYISKLSQRLVILRNLVALGQIGIEVILARKNRSLIDTAIQSQRRPSGELDGFAVQHRQSPRHPQAHGTNIGVGRSPEARRARAEDLRSRQKL